MLRVLKVVAFSLLIGHTTTSCSVIRIVEVPSPTATAAGSGQSFANKKDVKTSLWKSKNKYNIQTECNNGISRVKVTTKPMDVVLGVFTLGFFVRQRLEW